VRRPRSYEEFKQMIAEDLDDTKVQYIIELLNARQHGRCRAGNSESSKEQGGKTTHISRT